jgi:hypothetical protein
LMWEFHGDLRLVAAAYNAGDRWVGQKRLNYLECPVFSVPVRNDKTGTERILQWDEARSIRQSKL